VWCLARCTRACHGATFIGDKYVGLQACALLFKMAAGFMQQDSEYLHDEHRLWLISLGLPTSKSL